MTSEPGLVLKVGASGWRLRPDEVDVLTDWLRAQRSLRASALKENIAARRSAVQPAPLTLGPDDIQAVRSVLCGTDLGDYHGLIALQTAVCDEIGMGR